jgi:hypothetical protein
MRTWNDTTYTLDTTEHLMLCRHDDSITLSLPGYMTDGRGITLYLRPAHLPELRDAVAALEALALGQDDDDPFPEADAQDRAARAADDAQAEAVYEQREAGTVIPVMLPDDEQLF